MERDSQDERWARLAVILLALGLFYTLRFTLFIPVDVLTVGHEYPEMIRGDRLTVWYDRAILDYRGLLVAVALLLPVLSLAAAHVACRRSGSDSRLAWWVRRTWPAGLLPLVAAARLLADRLPPALVTNLAFYLPVAVVAALLAPGWPGASSGVRTPVREWRWNAGLLLVATLVFYAWGMDLATTTGEHVGDEGHYLTQMESLYADHDLDIKNQIMSPALAEQTPLTAPELERQHVAPKSKGGHWYSWHPYGLPLVLAPLWKQGLKARYLAVALIAALGCLAMFRISRRAGASRLASAVAVAGIGASFYWAVYSARVLPEVPGATLLIWLVWAARAQEDKPWRATLVGAACCAYLAPMHIRFLPLSLMGMGWFGLFGLCGRESWPTKLTRLTVFALLCAAGYAAYFAVQQRLFGGSALVYGTVPVSQTLFSFPMGMWATIADVKGLVSVFPVFLWLGVALPVWMLTDRKERIFAFSLLTIFATCLLTSCTNVAGIGGACVSGRYLVVVIPLLAPAGAIMLDRSSSWARGWFLFLALASTAMLLLMALVLPDIGRGFALPVRTLRTFAAWQGLFQPHTSFITTPPNPYARFWATLFVLAGMAASLWLMLRPFLPRRRAIGILALVLATAVISHAIQAEYGPAEFQPGDVAVKLLHRAPGRVVLYRSSPASSWFTRWVNDIAEEETPLPNAPARPADGWRYLDPGDVIDAVDVTGNSCREALVDGIMDTRWTTFTGWSNFPSLTFSFARPVALCGIRLVSLNDRYPQELLLEGQAGEGGRWEPIPQTAWLPDCFWSGSEFLPLGAQFVEELRCAAPTGGIRRLRVTFAKGYLPHVVRLSEMLFMEQAPPPDAADPSREACLAAIRAAGVKQFYGPRWVTDWLARKLANDPDLQVPGVIPYSVDEWARYDPKFPASITLRETAGFMTDMRAAGRTRHILGAAGLNWDERPLGTSVMFVVPRPRQDDDAARYPLFYWTEAGLFAADTNRFALRKAQRIYDTALVLRDSPAAIPVLQRAIEVCPGHEPAREALIKALAAAGRPNEAAAAAAQLKALREPEIPAPIRFPGGIEFLGLAPSARSARPGDILRITYYWRCPPESEADRPTVFAHVVKGRKIVFQDDHALLEEQFPEDLRNQPFPAILTQRREMGVPETVVPGEYEMVIGLYYPKQKERLRPDTDLPVRRRAVRLPLKLQICP